MRARGSAKVEYATIDSNKSKQSQPIAMIVMIVIAPIIVAQDTH